MGHDLSNFPDDPKLDEGTYDVIVTRTEEKFTNSGDPMFVLELTDEDSRRTASARFVLNPDMGWMLKKFCRIFGFSEDNVEARNFLDCRFRATLRRNKKGYINLTAYEALESPAPPRQAQPEQRTSQPPIESTTGTKDDLPF